MIKRVRHRCMCFSAVSLILVALSISTVGCNFNKSSQVASNSSSTKIKINKTKGIDDTNFKDFSSTDLLNQDLVDFDVTNVLSDFENNNNKFKEEFGKKHVRVQGLLKKVEKRAEQYYITLDSDSGDATDAWGVACRVEKISPADGFDASFIKTLYSLSYGDTISIEGVGAYNNDRPFVVQCTNLSVVERGTSFTNSSKKTITPEDMKTSVFEQYKLDKQACSKLYNNTRLTVTGKIQKLWTDKNGQSHIWLISEKTGKDTILDCTPNEVNEDDFSNMDISETRQVTVKGYFQVTPEGMILSECELLR